MQDESKGRVVAAVVSRGDRYLVCRRPLNKRYGGLWEFPGGKCEPGETDESAARRELTEELGVEVLDVGKAQFVVKDPDSGYTIVFRTVHIGGEPECREHLAVRWTARADLLRLDLAPSDRRFVNTCLS